MRELDWSETDLRQVLVGMIKKGWVVQFVRRQELPEPLEGLNLDELADSYFVATRQGLLLHNSR
ncbi:MAG: hypothetical protein RMK52_05160 [Chitinophagales bacterium]|nr:hypothetical protein [Chitinophagales bacterium]MDW8393616.1 hypothetical protein [Chitinophagales bacterium]